MNSTELWERRGKVEAAAKEQEQASHERYLMTGAPHTSDLVTNGWRRSDRLMYQVILLRTLAQDAGFELERLERQVKVLIERRDVETLLVGFAHDLGLDDIDEADAHRYMQENGHFQDELVGAMNG